MISATDSLYNSSSTQSGVARPWHVVQHVVRPWCIMQGSGLFNTPTCEAVTIVAEPIKMQYTI